MARAKIIDLIHSQSDNIGIHTRFENDVRSAISRYDRQMSHKGSNNYKPSSLNCMRLMYFIRTEAPEDIGVTDSELIGMADTGSKRHESVQTVLSNMRDMGYDWEYVDVTEYLARKQAEGKCANLVVTGQKGNETHLIDEQLHVSFLCDGIVRYTPEDKYYLFEMKNVVSFKFNKVGNEPLDQHKNQVECYCALLDFDEALVLYENRDVCTLKCVKYNVSQQAKENIISRLIECETYVQSRVVPPKDTTNCQFCNYKGICHECGD